MPQLHDARMPGECRQPACRNLSVTISIWAKASFLLEEVKNYIVMNVLLLSLLGSYQKATSKLEKKVVSCFLL